MGKSYNRFVEILLESKVLKFGEFVTKSGRTSPYFFNTGNIDSGLVLAETASFYAQKISETFVLDEEMRKRLADLNPEASVRMANRLLEANDRNYWQPDPETLATLQGAADELEDRLEGIAAE